MFTRARQIASYNWPLYLVALLGALAGGAAAASPALPYPVRIAGAVGAAAAVWLAFASFTAFYLMFDHSELHSGRWLAPLLPHSPGRWVQISAGLEETTLPFTQVFPGVPGRSLALHDPSMTAPALNRARSPEPVATEPSACEQTSPAALPVEDGWADVACVVLAAHEVRDVHAREAFYRELARITAAEGRVAVVEHLRDLAAALAFGPGLFHFYPRREWLRLGDQAGLTLEREKGITPWVRVFVYRRAS
jgi:hypothetical protein